MKYWVSNTCCHIVLYCGFFLLSFVYFSFAVDYSVGVSEVLVGMLMCYGAVLTFKCLCKVNICSRTHEQVSPDNDSDALPVYPSTSAIAPEHRPLLNLSNVSDATYAEVNEQDLDNLTNQANLAQPLDQEGACAMLAPPPPSIKQEDEHVYVHTPTKKKGRKSGILSRLSPFTSPKDRKRVSMQVHQPQDAGEGQGEQVNMDEIPLNEL